MNNKAIAYALRAKDAWGNNIISNYDVKVIAKNEALDITNKEVDVVYTSSAKLDELFAAELSKVAAHYYSIEKLIWKLLVLYLTKLQILFPHHKTRYY